MSQQQQQQQGAKPKRGKPAHKPKKEPKASSSNHSRRIREADSESAATSRNSAQRLTPSPPSHLQEHSEPVKPTSHQIKMMLNYVCKADGSRMSLSSLKRCMASNQNLKGLVTGPLADILDERLQFAVDSQPGEDQVVKAVTELEICESYSTERACILHDMCPKLHICKSFVFDQICSRGKECPFGHDLKDLHNHPLMKDHCLDILSTDYGKRLLLENYVRRSFSVCKRHNTKVGCKLKDDCRALHLCKYFVQNRCKAKGQCPRSHDLTGPQPRLLLAKHGFDVEKHQDVVLQEQKDHYVFRRDTDAPDAEDDQSVGTETSAVSAKPRTENNPEKQQSENAKPQRLHQVKQILKHICKTNDGKMLLSSLKVTLSCDQSLKLLSEKELEKILDDFLPFTLGSERGANKPIIVKAVTKLEICESYSEEKACLLGNMCPKLHVCKPHALAQKCVSKACPFGHDLRNEHNLPLVKNHCLDVLTNNQLRTMLLQNYIRQNFRPCIKHSTNEGCQFKDQCKWLHVCKYFIQNRCTAQGQCPRSHDLMGSQPRRLLDKHGIDVEKHQDLVFLELKDHSVFRGDDTGEADDQSVNTETSKVSTDQQQRKVKVYQPDREPAEAAKQKSPKRPGMERTRKSKSKGLLPTPKTKLGLQEAMCFILFEVCEAGGSMNMDDLISTIMKKKPELAMQVQCSAVNLERMLMKWPNLFRVDKQDLDVTVIAFTTLTVCTKFGSNDGCKEECGKLHLCRNYLTNTCSFRKIDKTTGKTIKPCRYGHEVRNPHNLKVLAQHHLHKVRAKHVKLLVRENNHLKGKPMICRYYNSPRGCRFSSTATADKSAICKAMHVCYHHIKGICKGGRAQCSRAHSVLEPQPRAILLRHGINIRRPGDQIIQELREMMANDEKPESVFGDQNQEDPTDDDSEDDEDDLMAFSDDELIHFSTESSSSSDESEADELLISFDTPVAAPSSVPLIPLPDDRPATGSMEWQFHSGDMPLSSGLPLKKPEVNLNLPDDELPPEICLYHLRGQCGYKDSCRNRHCSTPYQWQEMVGGWWNDLSATDSRDLEVNYCDPCKTECFIGDPVVW